MNKIEKLRKILKGMGSLLIAYSGGADSTLLLVVARDVLQDRVLAVTADSPAYPPEEMAFAKKTAKALGARHLIIKTRELKDKNFVNNPPQRCYFCKKGLFRRLQEIALKSKLNFVADASNISDRQDHRPGNQAKREFKVRSPFQEAGFTKQDIRKLSKKLGLGTWNKPALACLASRIPYGTRITPALLKRINSAERGLKELGFKQVRLRHYNGLCRIEVSKNDIPALIGKRAAVVRNLKKLGYNYITLDLEGYRSGSLNRAIK
ncbi:MAG: ATP-dependent sacrificial sulfur transferase LarE [Candidatus Omnitrophota bacterium]|jgi:uncharacterized protein